jgi:pyrimidine operon attenuation protein/uracil phosphoribosyltransferase
MSESEKSLILNNNRIQKIIDRLAYQILENQTEASKIIFCAIEGNGVAFAKKVAERVMMYSDVEVLHCSIHINKNSPSINDISIENENYFREDISVILVDDVLNSGKTLMFAAKKILQFPLSELKTLVLVDRHHRKFPIRSDYVGLSLTTTLKEHVEVQFHNNNFYVYLQ